MFDRVSQVMLVFNEISLYFISALTFAFTDYTSVDVTRYSLGTIWVICVLITFVIDVLMLFLIILYGAKISADRFVEIRRR